MSNAHQVISTYHCYLYSELKCSITERRSQLNLNVDGLLRVQGFACARSYNKHDIVKDHQKALKSATLVLLLFTITNCEGKIQNFK